jgi:hypothetical protein
VLRAYRFVLWSRMQDIGDDEAADIISLLSQVSERHRQPIHHLVEYQRQLRDLCLIQTFARVKFTQCVAQTMRSSTDVEASSLVTAVIRGAMTERNGARARQVIFGCLRVWHAKLQRQERKLRTGRSALSSDERSERSEIAAVEEGFRACFPSLRAAQPPASMHDLVAAPPLQEELTGRHRLMLDELNARRGLGMPWLVLDADLPCGAAADARVKYVDQLRYQTTDPVTLTELESEVTHASAAVWCCNLFRWLDCGSRRLLPKSSGCHSTFVEFTRHAIRPAQVDTGKVYSELPTAARLAVATVSREADAAREDLRAQLTNQAMQDLADDVSTARLCDDTLLLFSLWAQLLSPGATNAGVSEWFHAAVSGPGRLAAATVDRSWLDVTPTAVLLAAKLRQRSTRYAELPDRSRYLLHDVRRWAVALADEYTLHLSGVPAAFAPFSTTTFPPNVLKQSPMAPTPPRTSPTATRPRGRTNV